LTSVDVIAVKLLPDTSQHL